MLAGSGGKYINCSFKQDEVKSELVRKRRFLSSISHCQEAQESPRIVLKLYVEASFDVCSDTTINMLPISKLKKLG